VNHKLVGEGPGSGGGIVGMWISSVLLRIAVLTSSTMLHKRLENMPCGIF